MPQLLAGPELTALKSELPSPHIAAVLSVMSALPGPPDRPALGHVLRIARLCCDEAVANMRVITPQAGQLQRALRLACGSVADMPAIDGAALMRGQITRFPAWNCFASMDARSPRELLQLAGAELLNAVNLRRPFRRSISARIASFDKGVVNDSGRTLDSMKVLARKVLDDVAAADHASSGNSKSLLLAARIKAALAEQLDAQNLDDRKACGSARELSVSETREGAAALKREVERGNLIALLIVIAYCCGPTWETVLEFPFAEHAGDDWVARIDARAGVVNIDLTSLLELAPAKAGHAPARPVLSIHLPEFAAERLRISLASDPSARCLKELVCLDRITPRAALPGMPADASIPATIARFIRGRATIAIANGVDRGVAAYACGDLAKVGKSSHSYNTYDALTIWQGNARRYEALGWGSPVAQTGAPALGVGSMATPTAETVRHIDAAFVHAAEASRAGRRYTWASLVRHHNPYARLCAHRTAFFTLARGAAQFGFYADMLDESCATAGLVDKRVGPFSGATPLPMPVRLAQQIAFWKAHLQSLQDRITRLKPTGWQRIVQRIDSIEDGRHVPLFFLVQEDGSIKEFGSEELLAQHPDTLVKPDWARHFGVNALRDVGVPFSIAAMQLRHHIDGLALTDLYSETPMLFAMEQLAHGLDRVAFELEIHPVVGLSGGKGVRRVGR